jgi:hypothetical protein
MFRFLKVLFLLYLGNSMRKRLSRPTQKAGARNASHSRARRRYSLQSERLWEKGPVNTRFKIKYRSDWQNKNGDPVFYRKGDDPLLVAPVITPKLDGCFAAYPGGLNIDPVTGEIDINNSDTGISYEVEFTPCGQQSVAVTTVVIGGVGFQGGISSLSGDAPITSKPHYFSHDRSRDVPSLAEATGRYGYIPEKVRRTGNLLGLTINERTGEIDIRKTISSGALGFRPEGGFPVNGTSKEFRIYYQLDDAPNKEVDSFTAVRIHFFDTQDDIPDELLARMRQTRNTIFQKTPGILGQQAPALALLLGVPMAWGTDWPGEALAALMAALTSWLFLNAHETNNPLRPPEHVVTQ